MVVMLLCAAWVFMALWSGLLASSRGHSPTEWFMVGAVFGPFAVLFAFFLKPNVAAPTTSITLVAIGLFLLFSLLVATIPNFLSLLLAIFH